MKLKISAIVLALAAAIPVANSTGLSLPHKQQIDAHPFPELSVVEGREMKFLIDPAKVNLAPEDGLKAIWQQFKTFAEQQNVNLIEKPTPDSFTYSTKVYYDTPDGKLAKKGYVLRITTKYEKGQASSAGLTLKYINKNNPQEVFASMPSVDDFSIEENVGPGANNSLDTYLEKATKAKVDLSKRPETMGEFAKLIPHLKKLGIPSRTKLIGKGAYSIRMKPGYVKLPASHKPAGISMEAWLPLDGADNVFVYDFSFGYGVKNYYRMPATHAGAEQIMHKLNQAMSNELGLDSNVKWRGSKASYLRFGGLDVPNYEGRIISDLDGLFGELPAGNKAPSVTTTLASYKANLAIKPSKGTYQYAIDEKGHIALNPSKAQLHKARFGGEIRFDKKQNAWVINNKSTTKHTSMKHMPRQLGFVAKLIQDNVKAGNKNWAPSRFFTAYTNTEALEDINKNKELKIIGRNSNAYIEVATAASLEMRPYTPSKFVEGVLNTATYNDDPS